MIFSAMAVMSASIGLRSKETIFLQVSLKVRVISLVVLISWRGRLEGGKLVDIKNRLAINKSAMSEVLHR